MDGWRNLPSMSRLSPFSLRRFYYQQPSLRQQMESPDHDGEAPTAGAVSVDAGAGPVLGPLTETHSTAAAEGSMMTTDDSDIAMSKTGDEDGVDIAKTNNAIKNIAQTKAKEVTFVDADAAPVASTEPQPTTAAEARLPAGSDKSPVSGNGETNGAAVTKSGHTAQVLADAKVKEAIHADVKQVAQTGQVQDERDSMTQIAALISADKSPLCETSEVRSADIVKLDTMSEASSPGQVKEMLQIGLVEWKPDSVLYNSHYEAHVLPPLDYTKDEALGMLAVDIDRNDHEGDVDTLCASCDNPGMKKCQACLTGYCSRECQLADWAIHKHICGQLAGDFADDKRPTPEHHRILFFPAFEHKLQFHWAIRHKTDQGDWWLNNHADLLTYGTTKGIQGIFQYKKQEVIDAAMVLPDRRIGRALTLVTYDIDNYHGPSEKPDPRVVNRSLNALLGPGFVRARFGPIIFFSELTLPNEAPLQTRDVTARDLHTLVRYLERRDGLCLSVPQRFRDETIPALRINDIAPGINQAVGVPKRFESVHCPLRPSVRPDYICAIPFLLGLRWYLRPANPAGAEPQCTLWKDNNMKYLGLVCEPRELLSLPDGDDAGAGCDDDDEDKENRPVAVSAEVLDILPPTARIICPYAYGPFMTSVLLLHGSGTGRVDWRHVMALNAYLDEAYISKTTISRKGFAAFWEEYKASKVAVGRAEWTEAPSPWQWEGQEFKDRLGVFNPSLVRLKISEAVQMVWLSVMRAVNGVRVRGWGAEVQM
ncbi:hypothetical protein VTJ83DRAFT_2276 [Remersonia thermophila]|uniref:MYND-type domain-containing protein n=1 Tax=Remersonia thermophila TaxID=72144 RepID=A0ABR4DKL0_9PEZI